MNGKSDSLTVEKRSKRLSVDELMRLAFIHAEQDVSGLVEAWPKNAPETAEFKSLLAQLHAYRMKRWGRTDHEGRIARAKLVDVRKHGRFLP